jgi:DNA-binding protein HU-beta
LILLTFFQKRSGDVAETCTFAGHSFHIIKIHKMNKGDLINKIATDAGVTKAQATDALNAVVDGITATLQAGDKVTLIGFGTFSISKREARSGRNPQTGKTITIAAKNVVRFKPGKELADKVN